MIMIARVLFYCIVPKMVRNEDLVHPEWVMLLVKINHLLLTINSAVNILLYSYKVAGLLSF